MLEKIFCHWLGWHLAPPIPTFGPPYTGYCPRCCIKVAFDSHGNWVEVLEPPEGKFLVGG